MQRRAIGRDPGLTARMAIALVLLACTYVGLIVGCALLIAYRSQYAVWWIVALVAIGTSLATRYRSGGRAILDALGATVAPTTRDGTLSGTVERLAVLADVATPEVVIADTDAMNALAVGLRRRRSTLVVTRGLVEALDHAELEAVLAHEISHLANRDAAVMTAVAAPRLLGEVVVGGAGEGRGLIWLVAWPLGIIPLALGTALTLMVSRYREFAADRGSALLTGAPEQLMSALEKLSGHAMEIPHEDLRAANAFCIVSTETKRFDLFSDHPPLQKRLAALAEIARELGRPVS
jgi:heat shock protein HtpX